MSPTTDVSSNKETYSSTFISATVVFVVTFLLIGIPVWWKTTEVYRYNVPHGECQKLLSEKVLHTIPVKIFLADRSVQQGLFWEELLPLKEAATGELAMAFRWTMSTVTKEEQKIVEEAKSVEGLNNALLIQRHDYIKESFGEIKVFILHSNFSNEPKFTLGNKRQGYVINDGNHKSLAFDVYSLSRKMAQVDKLQKLYTKPSSYSADKIPDKDRMRYLRFSKNFDITFSLIVLEPHHLNVHWDIKSATESYLDVVLADLKLISTVKVKSQVLYMTSLPVQTSASLSEDGERKLYSSHMSSLVNPIEARLGSDTSLHPNLNFVLYVPTRDQTLLRIYDLNMEPLGSNAFLLPQWGGVMIYNCPVPENASLPHAVELDSKKFMGVFLSQLRLLLGLSDISEITDSYYQVLKGPVIRKWELDFLLRKNAQEHLSSAMSSLSSLSQLLQTIGNIVIKDDIGEKIQYALSSTKESLELLSRGDLLQGFFKAQSAFTASDEAFFDPSLLALLYFPEDQKYAIYIPLFLPISIPVLSSLLHLWKYWKQRKQKLKHE